LLALKTRHVKPSVGADKRMGTTCKLSSVSLLAQSSDAIN
jgi:hypothetical protein